VAILKDPGLNWEEAWHVKNWRFADASIQMERTEDTSGGTRPGGWLTDLEIAAKVGISDRQLPRWKRTPEFEAGVEEHRKNYREILMKEAGQLFTMRLAQLGDRADQG
jgi:hypothetical protein